MAKCNDCGQKMIGSVSCTKPMIKIGGKWYKRNTSYFDQNKNCHDCGIVNRRGNIHHIGCDIEKCPKCRGQLLSCDCDKGKYFETGGNRGMGMGGNLQSGLMGLQRAGANQDILRRLGLR